MFASLKAVASLLTATFIMMIGFGVASYVTPLRAMDEGWSMTVISLIATVYSIGFFLSAMVTPLIVRRVGHIRAFGLLVAVLILAILGAGLVVDWTVWLILRGITGFAMAGLYMVNETWLNEQASNDYRGALMSVYMIAATVAAVLGQFIVPHFDRAGTDLFIIAAIAYAIALFPIMSGTAPAPAPPALARIDLRRLWRRTPVAFVGSLLTGLLNGGWVGMAAVYSVAAGLDAQAGAELQAAVIFGSMLFQIPVGRLSDVIDRRLVMVISGAVGLLGSIAMMVVPISAWWPFHIAAFAMGSVLFPIYTLNSAHANDMAGPGEVVSVSASIGFLYGLGVIIGPALAGQLISMFGPVGMPAMLAGGFLLYGLYALMRLSVRQGTPPGKAGSLAVNPLAGAPSLPATGRKDD